jgi:hypothetical protein
VTLPLGYRNKNPTNLRYQEKWNWPGVVGIDAKRFAIFASPEDGLAQWIRQMRRYQKRGLGTIADIIPVYAPRTDNNDEGAYIASVSKMSGVAPTQPIRWEDRDETIRLMRAFVRHELGAPPSDWPGGEWYDMAVYRRACDKAKPLSNSRTIAGSVGAATATIAGAVVEVATQQADTIAGAAGAASGIWPKWAPIIAAVVTLCMIAVVVYARLQRTKPDVLPTTEDVTDGEG